MFCSLKIDNFFPRFYMKTKRKQGCDFGAFNLLSSVMRWAYNAICCSNISFAALFLYIFARWIISNDSEGYPKAISVQ